MPIQGEFLLFKSNGFLDSALDGDARTITLPKPPSPFPLSSTQKGVLPALLDIFYYYKGISEGWSGWGTAGSRRTLSGRLA